MPSFAPFSGIRYAPDLDPADVTAPPYDVIDAQDRAALAARSSRNVVHLDLPDEAAGPGRYAASATTLAQWLDDGTLVRDPAPTFTVYRMTFRDDRGREARTLGVIGALALSRPDEGQILPHEHTTPKAKTDRLDLLRATCTNLSPIWVLSLADGLTDLLEPDGPPDAEWTDDDGVGHASWVVDDPDRIERIAAAVGSTPVVVADGHHRYETSLQHRDERRAEAEGGGALDSDATMALVVELTSDELCVRPIHRLVDGLTPDELRAALLAGGFDEVAGTIDAASVEDGSVLDAMDSAGAVALVAGDGSATLLRPRRDAFAGVDDLDSARVGQVLADLDGVDVRFQHGTDLVARAVVGGEAAAGLLLRPATVAQIEDNAHASRRMPAKTTFFHPKPRTGVVVRPC